MSAALRPRYRWLCVLTLVLVSVLPPFATAAKLDGIDLPAQYEDRYKALIDQLRCLVCQNDRRFTLNKVASRANWCVTSLSVVMAFAGSAAMQYRTAW